MAPCNAPQEWKMQALIPKPAPCPALPVQSVSGSFMCLYLKHPPIWIRISQVCMKGFSPMTPQPIGRSIVLRKSGTRIGNRSSRTLWKAITFRSCIPSRFMGIRPQSLAKRVHRGRAIQVTPPITPTISRRAGAGRKG